MEDYAHLQKSCFDGIKYQLACEAILQPLKYCIAGNFHSMKFSRMINQQRKFNTQKFTT